MRGFIYILILFFLPLINKGQDPQFSLLNATPLFINPANTGNMDGTVRGGLAYRNQWNTIAASFEAAHLFADYKTNIPQLNDRALGLGIQFTNDRSGNGVISNNALQISASTPFYLTKDQSQLIHTGLFLGFYQGALNNQNFNFESNFDYTSVQFNGTNTSIAGGSSTAFDLGLGAAYHYYDITGKQLVAGVSFAHPHEPKLTYNGIANENRVFFRNTWHIDGRYPVQQRFVLTPVLYYINQKNNNATVIGSGIEYPLGRRVIEKIDLLGGVYYRVKDAVILTAGMNHENWTFQFGYDINASKLTEASNGNGAIEISITYTNRMFKGHKDLRFIVPGTRLL
jgi:type IX secretion system PorP/SprF family membrane protein